MRGIDLKKLFKDTSHGLLNDCLNLGLHVSAKYVIDDYFYLIRILNIRKNRLNASIHNIIVRFIHRFSIEKDIN